MRTGLMAVLLLVTPAANERVEYVISQLVAKGFTQPEAEALFQDPRLKILPPQQVAAREIDWDQVIRGLVAPASVERGSKFLARYQETLRQADSKFGIDPIVLTALLRLESNLGENTGNYGTFNVFYTLLTQREEEQRWRWAGDNLAALATYCKSMGNDCFEIRGSYGGALGAAQFLPYSVIEYGADGNGDNRVDPFLMEDAIVSAANFLVVHGWHEDQEQALAKYYGTGQGYPRAVFAYVEALKAAETASQSTAAPQP
ncbi:MAG: lytic murein transglycosylase [Acidobacteria bacterium]|nr:lytic murein transglycosylase [Acidobacteriota bacterium]